LVGTTGVIIHYTTDPENSLQSIASCLALSFIPAIIMPIIIGFQGKIKSNFLRCLFHAYLAVFLFYIINGLILYFRNFSFDFLSCLVGSISAPAFIPWRFSDEIYVVAIIIYATPIVSTLLMALLLFVFRKSKHKTIQIGGQIFTFLLFGVYYIACTYYFINSLRGLWIPTGTH
jgi:hypothetical protein